MTAAAMGLAAWVAISIAGAAPGDAQRSPGLGGNPSAPWVVGVTPEREQEAWKWFREGNNALQESSFQDAVNHYSKALDQWDHPAIHFNLSLALMNLLRLVECHKHLEAALRYGPEPLDPEKYERGKNLKATVEERLVWLQLTCDTEGSKVTLDDNAEPFVCPMTIERWIQPGVHHVRAEKEGFEPTDKNLILKEGAKLRFPIKLYTTSERTRYRSRWPQWLPVTVMGAGAAVAAGGGLLHWGARNQFFSFDEGIKACGGCVPPIELAQVRTRGNVMQGVAVGSYVVGGSVLVMGAALLFLNAPQPYLIDPDAGPQVSAVPLLGPAASGMMLTFRF